MKNNYIISTVVYAILVMTILFAGLGDSALAVDTIIIPETPAISTFAAPAEPVPASLDRVTKLSTLVSRGTQLIDQRLKDLKSIQTKNNSSTLTIEQKDFLNKRIDEYILNLNNLSNQIKVGTDVDAVRSQVKSIYVDYRVYAVFLPSIRLNMSLFTQDNYQLKLNDSLAKVQQRLDEAKANGKNTTTTQQQLDQAKQMLQETHTRIGTLLSKASDIKPFDYQTTSTAKIKEIRTGIKEVQTDLVKIRNSLRIRLNATNSLLKARTAVAHKIEIKNSR